MFSNFEACILSIIKFFEQRELEHLSVGNPHRTARVNVDVAREHFYPKDLGERQMGIYQYKPEAQASAETTHQSIQALTRLRFGLVLVNSHLPLA